MLAKIEKMKGLSLTLVRLVIGALFIAHGLAKWGLWQAAPSDQMPAMMLYIMRALSIIEPVAGVLMILGAFVPVVGLVFVVIMLGAIPTKIFVFEAVFTGGWSYDLLILVSSLALASHGGGLWTVEKFMPKKKSAMSSGMPSQQPPQAPMQ